MLGSLRHAGAVCNTYAAADVCVVVPMCVHTYAAAWRLGAACDCDCAIRVHLALTLAKGKPRSSLSLRMQALPPGWQQVTRA